MLDNHIKQLSQEMELTEPLVFEAGSYIFPLDDQQIKISQTPEGHKIYSNVAPCPTTNREKFLSEAMYANLFGQGTRDAVLSLSEDGNMLTLTREVNYNADYKDFRESLEDFITVLDFWREEAQKESK